MWVTIGAGVAFVLTLFFSLAKVSSKGDEISKQHREELLARKNKKQLLTHLTDEEQELVEKKRPPHSG